MAARHRLEESMIYVITVIHESKTTIQSQTPALRACVNGHGPFRYLTNLDNSGVVANAFFTAPSGYRCAEETEKEHKTDMMYTFQ